MKQVLINPMERMLKGFDLTADAVIGTLGPRGRNVFIDDPMAPKITNDGATIAKSISFPDKFENMGAYIVKNTSSQTNDDAGDGTTTTAALLKGIVHESIARPENAMVIKDSLKEASKKIVASLKKKSVKLSDSKDIFRIAEISSENRQIAKFVSEIVEKVGEDAVITVEDSQTFESSYEVIQGYEANVGFMSPDFVNDKGRARCVMEDVPVFVTDKKISTLSDITPLFNMFKSKGISSAVIVCDDIENSILGLLTVNKRVGSFNSVVIRATGDMLKDIEASVGAKRVSDQTGVTFQSFKSDAVIDPRTGMISDYTYKAGFENLGKVKKVIVDANKSIFIPANVSSATVYANQLQKFADIEPNMYVKERLNKRVSQLRGGVAVLRIGAHTDFEREYLKLKAEDTIKAVKAALEEGIVEGGGMALWRIAAAMKPKTVGEHILKKALTAPLRKIIENAGKDYAEIIKDVPEGMGYDAKRDEYVDMLKAGIIDPTKVERVALENSVSAASTFITTFAAIADAQPEKDNS